MFVAGSVVSSGFSAVLCRVWASLSVVAASVRGSNADRP